MFYLRLNNLNNNVVVLCNNQPLQFKKANGKFVAKIDDVQAQVCFTYRHELVDNLWFLKALGFYILSFFGLFMRGYPKTFYSLDVEVQFTPQISNTYYDIIINNNPNAEYPITISGGQYYFLSANKFIKDEKAKKNYRIFKTFSILTRLFVIILVVVIIIVSFTK